MNSPYAPSRPLPLLPFFLLIFTVVLSTACHRAEPLAVDGESQARADVQYDAQHAFLSGNFQQLEATAHDLRDSKARFPSGQWKLHQYYMGLKPVGENDESYKNALDTADRWIQAYPASITPRVAKGLLLKNYAWFARGSGYANTVSSEAWVTFGQRLDQARAVLEDADKLVEKCPEWFVAMQIVALGQGWEKPQYEALFNRAIAFEPTYYDIQFSRAYWLLPRWYGAQGEWESYAHSAVAEDPAEGMAIYARIAWANSRFFGNLFTESAVSWPDMRQGFRDMMKQYPASQRNLNAFCRFAYMAQDKATVRDLLPLIGQTPDLDIWRQQDSFDHAKAWAATGL